MISPERLQRMVEGGYIRLCVGSGHCCVQAQCMGSLQLHGKRAVCPELLWDGERHRCGLMAGDAAEYWRERLYEGRGCPSSLNSWRKDLRDRRNEHLVTRIGGKVRLKVAA